MLLIGFIFHCARRLLRLIALTQKYINILENMQYRLICKQRSPKSLRKISVLWNKKYTIAFKLGNRPSIAKL